MEDNIKIVCLFICLTCVVVSLNVAYSYKENYKYCEATKLENMVEKEIIDIRRVQYYSLRELQKIKNTQKNLKCNEVAIKMDKEGIPLSVVCRIIK